MHRRVTQPWLRAIKYMSSAMTRRPTVRRKISGRFFLTKKVYHFLARKENPYGTIFPSNKTLNFYRKWQETQWPGEASRKGGTVS